MTKDNTADNQDWRDRGQGKYFAGVVFTLQTYQPPSAQWDHEHCEYCFAKITADSTIADSHQVAYASADKRWWVCETCFADFRLVHQLLTNDADTDVCAALSEKTNNS